MGVPSLAGQEVEDDLVDVEVAAGGKVAGHDLERQLRPLLAGHVIAPNWRQPLRSTVQPRVLEPGIGLPWRYSRSPMVTVVFGDDGRTQALVW